MAFYESTFVARQEISEKDVDKLTNDFSDVVKNNGGKVIKTEYWGLRDLAYPINKGKKGHYVFLGLEGGGSLVQEIEKKYRMSEDVIRHLTVKVKEISKDESALLKPDADDDSDGKFDRNKQKRRY